MGANEFVAILDQIAITILAFSQCFFSILSCTAATRLFHLALNRRRKPHQVAFHQVVLGAGAHCCNRDFLTDRARDDYKGNVQTEFFDNLQSAHRVKPGHHKVAQNDIPLVLDKRLSHGVACVNAAVDHFIAGSRQMKPKERSVAFRVFDI